MRAFTACAKPNVSLLESRWIGVGVADVAATSKDSMIIEENIMESQIKSVNKNNNNRDESDRKKRDYVEKVSEHRNVLGGFRLL